MANLQHDEDLLSDLPLGLLENILVCLPIRDAIRTSVLSTNWRFKWTTIPHLVFYEDDSYNMDGTLSMIENLLKTFVTRTLLRHQGTLQRFKLVSTIYNCRSTDDWLILLSRKDIKELILKIDEYGENMDPGYFEVPSHIFSLQNLTCLKLYGCRFSSPPPNLNGFLYLKTLILRDVGVHQAVVQSIVAHSPLLEKLEYSGTLPSVSEVFVISTPKLKYLDLQLPSFDKLCLCTPLLAKLSLWPQSVNNQENPVCCNYIKFLGGLANLETLTANEAFLRYLSIGIEHFQHPLVFHCLTTIKLDVSFKTKNALSVAVRLIVDASTTLSKLRVYIYDFEKHESTVPGVHSLDSISAQNCIFGKLKWVKVEHFHGWIQEMDFIKFLVARSPLLKKMVIIPADKFLEYTKKCIIKMQDSRIVIKPEVPE